MKSYEKPSVLASFKVKEIVAAAATGMGGYGHNEWPWFTRRGGH